MLEMIQDSLDHRRVFDASDGLDGAAAAVAGFDVDVDPLEVRRRLGGLLNYYHREAA